MDFQEFEKDWKRKHKASLPQRPKPSLNFLAWIVFWLIVAIGAAIFSGSHTIPAAAMTIFADVPNRDLLALTGFILTELVIFGSSAGRHKIRWLTLLLVAAILVGLVSNTSSSLQAIDANGGNDLNRFSGVLLAILAPFTALAAGEVLHRQLQDRDIAVRASWAEYTDNYKALDAKILASYTKYEKGRSDYDELQPDYGNYSSDYKVTATTTPATKRATKTTAPATELRSRTTELQNDYENYSETAVVTPLGETNAIKRKANLRSLVIEIRENGDEELTTTQMIQKYDIPRGSVAKLRKMLLELRS